MSDKKEPPEIPRHIAIIMDGNGRWAKERGLERSQGHREGVKAIEPIVTACDGLGVKALTLYAFSTENWNRPKTEIDVLMELLREFFALKIPAMVKAGVRVRVLGDKKTIPAAQRALMDSAEAMTARNTGIVLNIAFNYGARSEIAAAARSLADKARRGQIDPEAIDENVLDREMYTAGLPPVDLMIRTGGETRLSNFLLYQLAYAELSFIPEYWPEFSVQVLAREIEKFAQRERRYGGLGAREQA